MRLVYRVISFDELREDRSLALGIRSDAFQLIPNSRRMQYHENKGITLQTLREKQEYQVKKIKVSRLLVQRINGFKYRQEMTQNVLTVLYNTLHYLRLSH